VEEKGYATKNKEPNTGTALTGTGRNIRTEMKPSPKS